MGWRPTGYGVDSQRRKIWDLYPAEVAARIHCATIEPATYAPAAGTDWVLGNHSDELTPWVPVIAAAHRCKFWLLPCCHYNLDGTKFRHNHKQLGQYRTYLHFVARLAAAVGFAVDEENLRIPSTKYVSFVGRAPAHAAGTAEADAAAELRGALCRDCTSVDTLGWLPCAGSLPAEGGV